MDEIIITTNKKIYIIHLIEFIISGVIGFAALLYKDNLCSYFSDNILFSNHLFWIVWCLVFGVFIGIFGTLYCVYSLFRANKFIMKIKEDGFYTDNYGFVSWSNISNLSLDKVQGSSYITFDIKEGVLNNKCSNRMFSNPYIISLFYTGVNAKKIV